MVSEWHLLQASIAWKCSLFSLANVRWKLANTQIVSVSEPDLSITIIDDEKLIAENCTSK